MPSLPRAPPEWKDFPRPGEDVAARRQKGEQLSSAARLRGFVRKATLSVTASPCHLSRKGEALAKAKSLLLNGRLLPAVDRCGRNLLVLPRAPPSKDFPRPGEDVAVRRQKGEQLSPQATERVRPGSDPLRHGFAVPPLPKGRGFGRGVKFMLYRPTSSCR